MRLQRRIAFEHRLRLFRLRQAERAGADRVDAIRRNQRLDLGDLAGVVAGDDQLFAGPDLARHAAQTPSAARCWRVNSAMPARASASIRVKPASSNGVPSAVTWISTIPPTPVNTKLASVLAVESSALSRSSTGIPSTTP